MYQVKTTTYSSPLAYLNRFFKGRNKFKYIVKDDIYENSKFRLYWVEGEIFDLEVLIKEYDTGAQYFTELSTGLLIDLVQIMRQYDKV